MYWYKGYQIDMEEIEPHSFIIYDPLLGDYLEHEPLYTIGEAKAYIREVLIGD